MKFVIQKIENQITHDFSFTLLDAIRFYNWLRRDRGDRAFARYVNTKYDSRGILQDPEFKKYHRTYIPVGSVEFVTQFLQEFHGLTPKPINVPTSLFSYAFRRIFNGTEEDVQTMVDESNRTFVKSNDVIKGFTQVYKKGMDVSDIPKGNYQISRSISIDSEWRAFVYKGKLEGLQHYVGEFTLFPDVRMIKHMIEVYEASKEAPIAYTLDVGINDQGTFVIEVHDFFSCGLYGFTNHAILPSMFGRWYYEYIGKNGTARNI